jgi:hypothetical protein
MSKYAYIVGADYKYVPELCALLNSLDYVGNTQDVHVIGINLPDELVSQFPKLNYEVFHSVISPAEVEESRGISEVVCRKRYWYAAFLGQALAYKAVCVLDADMIFNRDPYQWFEVAHQTGYIIGVSKEQNKVYDDPHHEVDGQWIIPQGYWNDKDLCNCPLFIDPITWGVPLKRSWDLFIKHGYRAPDMDAMNMTFIEAGANLSCARDNKIIRLPALQWLGTNEQMLKPYIRAIRGRDGKLWTENGFEIYSFHGHYYHEKWRNQQLENRSHCAAGYLGCNEKTNNMAAGALDLLHRVFKDMLDYKIVIEKKSYRE